MVNLDIVHRPTGHLIPEATSDHVQVAHVELLERLCLDALDTTVFQLQLLRVYQIRERERAQLADPYIFEDDRFNVTSKDETRYRVDAAVPHGYSCACILRGQLEALSD